MIRREFVNWDGVVFENAIYKITGVTSHLVDYEFLSPTSETVLNSTFVVKCESRATVYVYADEGQVDNRARPEYWFTFPFEYDDSIDCNIFTVAYDALNEKLNKGDSV